MNNNTPTTHTQQYGPICGPKMITLAQAKALLRPLFISIKKTPYGEYRVAPITDRYSVIAYYGTDLLDCYRTGVKMGQV